MLQGAQFADALAGARSGNDRTTLGIGKALELICKLASHSDPVKQPERELTPAEKVWESWKP